MVESVFQRAWINRVRARLRRNRKNRCLACGATHTADSPLEFAHRRSTGLNGPGRGSSERVMDIQKNHRAYSLLCKTPCHRLFDRGLLHPPSRGRGWRCDFIDRNDYGARAQITAAMRPAQYWEN